MFIKKIAYQTKTLLKRLFSYPTQKIILQNDFDYDTYWQDKRGKKIGELSKWQKLRAEFILRNLAHDGADLCIADIGCGDGSILNYLKTNEPHIQKMYGFDSSVFALGCARDYGIETIVLDVSDSYSYDKFIGADFYLLLETLEHVPHSEKLLFSALKNSSRGVFFSFPNTGYITHRLRLLFGKFPLQWRVFPNEHVRFWTNSDLKWWLGALEISNYSIHYYEGVPYLNKIWPGLFAAGFIVKITK